MKIFFPVFLKIYFRNNKQEYNNLTTHLTTMPKICEEEFCTSIAKYNFKHEKGYKYCTTHKKSFMILLEEKSKYCIDKDCTTRANFNVPNIKKAIYCGEHADHTTMINVNAKRCLDCNSQASFNFKGLKTALYCSEHAEDNMFPINSPFCKEKGCEEIAYYNFRTEKKRLYCSEHKQDKMVDIIHLKILCNNLECTKQGVYALPTQLDKRYCNTHKEPGMTDVSSPKCNEEGCTTTAHYNLPGEKSPLYCSKHIKDGMIHLHKKYCIEKSCVRWACYNLPGEKERLYCADHKKPNMIALNGSQCIINDCIHYAKYNYSGEKSPLYCSGHKKDKMIDVAHPRCKTALCETFVSNKSYEGHCSYCFCNLFPDKPNAKNYKTKEKTVKEAIYKHFAKEQFSWIDDKTVEGGCSRKRPDLFLDLGFQVVIIEIDENQHKKYGTSCENARVMQISQDIGFRNMVFIRFNPDSYIHNSKTIKSCWSANKSTGLVSISSTKQKEWTQRIQTLIQKVEYFSKPENAIDKMIHVEHLFYDDNVLEDEEDQDIF